MRYYLAIEAFLGAVPVPPQERLEKRLREWFAAIERYPRQLHEMEQGEYLDMKRKSICGNSPNPTAAGLITGRLTSPPTRLYRIKLSCCALLSGRTPADR